MGLVLIQTAVFSQYSDWTVYTHGNHITAIDGETDFLWVGTTGGLVKVNRTTLQTQFLNTANSGLPLNYITSISVDAQGDKWIGTFGRGLVRFNGSSSTVYYNYPQIPSDTVLVVNLFGSTVRIGTTRGIAELTGSTWSTISGPNFLPSDTVTAMLSSPTGHAIIGTPRGAALFDGIAYRNVTWNLPDPVITCVTVDLQDSAWVGMNDGGIAKYRSSMWVIYNTANTRFGLPTNSVHSMTADWSGQLWIGTATNGLVRFLNNQWTNYNIANSGLPDNDVTSLLAESSGDLWVGTRGGGIARFSGAAWTRVETANSGLQEDAVLGVAFDLAHEILWACGFNYIAQFDGMEWITTSAEQMGVLQGGFTGLVLDLSGNPWVSTFEQGLFHYNGIEWLPVNTTNTPGFPDNFVSALALNPADGNVWIATNNGVGRYNGTGWITFNTTSTPPIPSSLVRTLGVGSDGTVWIADDRSAGPIRFDQTAWFVADASSIGILPGSISAIWVSETGNPWIGTTGQGIAHYSNGGWLYHWTTLNSGLPGDDIKTLQADRDNNLWIGTTRGMVRLQRPGTFSQPSNISNSGLPSNRVQSLAVDGQNRVYAATDNGLAVYTGVMHTGFSNLFIRNYGMFEFGTTMLGQSVTVSSWILNTGNQPLSIDSLGWIENVPGAYEWLSPQLPYTVPANDSVQVSIRFTPLQVIFYGGQVRLFSNSIGSPDTLYIGGSVTAPQVLAPFQLHPSRFSMISVPGILQNTDIRSAFSSSLGPYSPDTWRVFYWKNGRYLELSQFTESDSLSLKPGLAFWLIPRDTVEILLQNIIATPPIVYEGPFARAADYPIRLQSGWNMIGNPFAYPVSWNQIGESELVYRPVSYNGWNYTYQLELLNPWEGYFVYNPQDTSVTLHVPPFPVLPKSGKTIFSEHEFSIDIQARGIRSGMITSQTRVGMLNSASDGRDREDYPEAPPIGSALQLTILDQGVSYAGNFRTVSIAGAAWDLRFGTTEPAEMTLWEFSGWDHLPDGFSIWLMDKDRECMIPVRNGQSEVFIPDSGSFVNLCLIIGTQAYADFMVGHVPVQPLEFALLPNMPNPFNPETLIEFHLAQQCDVNLQIFNVKGQRVRALVHTMMSAGKHEVIWDGTDDSGGFEGSGIYMVRMQCPYFQATQKVILIR
jgi:ligand-binding sensor domain-containing protein